MFRGINTRKLLFRIFSITTDNLHDSAPDKKWYFIRFSNALRISVPVCQMMVLRIETDGIKIRRNSGVDRERRVLYAFNL
jgi:hypothetical protein